MTSRVNIADKKLYLDDRPISLVSGEIHYWRLEPSVWPAVLAAARDMGLETIASYVQWHFHEVAEGKYDFTGETDPKRDLVAYLNLVGEANLNLLIRPGPYTFAEWDNYGVPDYVAGYHRLHPKFQASASNYIRAVCQVIEPFLVTHGGPIVLGQHRYDRQLGLLGGSGVFQDYLRDVYQSIGRLNDAWGTQYESFDQAMATTINPTDDPVIQVRFMDFLDFKHWFTHQAATWTISEYRSQGIDLPLYCNATKDQDVEQMVNVLDLVSFNHYPTRDYALVPDEHRQLVDHVRLLAAISPIPYIGELEAGIWHGYHYTKGLPHPGHYQYMLLSVLAGGAVAWTWYMLHDRDNWYMSPVNSRGKKRLEVFSVFRQFVQLAKPEDWELCTPTGITYYARHYSIQNLALEYQKSYEVSEALYQAGIDYSFYSLKSPGHPPKILFYDGWDWLDKDAQTALVEYVKSGGHLVVFQRCPRTDERGNPLNLLEILQPDGVDSQGYMNTFYQDVIVHFGDDDIRVPLPKAVFYYGQVPGEEIVATRTPSQLVMNDNVLEEYQFLVDLGREENLVIGYHQKVEKGSLTVLGLPPSAEVVVGIHRYLQISIPALPHTKGVEAALYRREAARYLIALNNGWEDKTVEIELAVDEFPPGQYRVRDLLKGEEKNLDVREEEPIMLALAASGRNGIFLEIAPL
jgi:hypothetical protein